MKGSKVRKGQQLRQEPSGFSPKRFQFRSQAAEIDAGIWGSLAAGRVPARVPHALD